MATVIKVSPATRLVGAGVAVTATMIYYKKSGKKTDYRIVAAAALLGAIAPKPVIVAGALVTVGVLGFYAGSNKEELSKKYESYAGSFKHGYNKK